MGSFQITEIIANHEGWLIVMATEGSHDDMSGCHRWQPPSQAAISGPNWPHVAPAASGASFSRHFLTLRVKLYMAMHCCEKCIVSRIQNSQFNFCILIWPMHFVSDNTFCMVHSPPAAAVPCAAAPFYNSDTQFMVRRHLTRTLFTVVCSQPGPTSTVSHW